MKARFLAPLTVLLALPAKHLQLMSSQERMRPIAASMLFVMLLLGGPSPAHAIDEQSAIEAAIKLCATQIKDPGIKSAHETKEGWEVILAPEGAQLPHADWWVVLFPSSGPTSDTKCFHRRAMYF